MKGRSDWRDGRVIRAETIAPDVRLIEFALDGAPPLQPGSHVTVAVTAGAAQAERSYSCLPCPAGRIRIAVKRHAASRGGSAFMWTLEEGATLRLALPVNRFELSWRAPDYLLAAGGIGITPILGMARALAPRPEPVRLVYGVHQRRQLVFQQELRECLGGRAEMFVGEEGRRIDLAAEIDALSPDGELSICGPLPMLAETKRLWAASGRKPTRLRYEVFGDSGAEPELAFRVEILHRGVSVDVQPEQSLLDALTAAGVDMVSDCRRGECGLCAVDIVDLDGRIDHRDVFLSDAEKDANRTMCACVSRLVGGSAVIDTGYRPA